MKFHKLINKKIVQKILYITIIFFNFFLFVNIQKIIYKKSFINKDLINSNRVLFAGIDNKKTEYVCDKADNELISLYEKESFDFDIINSVSIKKSTSYLYKYLENKNTSDLKKYIFSFIYEIILGILIFIIIILWIVLCCFLFNDNCCCLFINKNYYRCYKNIIYAISIISYLIIILLTLVILFKFYPVIQLTNNSFCSLFKISYHIYFGEDNNYKIRPKWIGINEIKNLLQNTKNQIESIIEKNKDIYLILNKDIKNDFFYDLEKEQFIKNNIKYFCNLSNIEVTNPNPLSNKTITNFFYCANILNKIQNEYNNIIRQYINDIDNIYEKMNSIELNKNEIKFYLDGARNKFDSFVKIIRDLEIEYYDKLFFIFDDIINKYFIYGFYLFFVFLLIIEFIGIISKLSSLCCSNSKYCYKLHITILNIQMLALIIVILITIAFSITSVLIKDLSIIIQYPFTKGNSESITKSSFSNVQYDIEGINICIQGIGNLEHYIQLDNDSEYLAHFYSKIKIIKENLNYLLNNKIFIEKNEISTIFKNLEENPHLIEYKFEEDDKEENYFDNNTYLSPEIVLENVLNKYTSDKNFQDIENNNYSANYIFVHSKEFCKSNYSYISKENNKYYKNGNFCMLLENFPENNYFKGITIKYLEDINQQNQIYYIDLMNLDNLTKEFKNRFYNIDKGFKSILIYLLDKSKSYLQDKIEPKCKKIQNSIIKIFQIMENKISIIQQLYGNIIGEDNTNLFSIFNCQFLKRDLSIFINQIDIFSHSLFNLSVYSLLIGLFSLLSIVSSEIALKLNNLISNYELRTKTKSEIDEKDINIDEKLKVEIITEKNIYDDNKKLSFNEKTGFYEKPEKNELNEKPKDN